MGDSNWAAEGTERVGFGGGRNHDEHCASSSADAPIHPFTGVPAPVPSLRAQEAADPADRVNSLAGSGGRESKRWQERGKKDQLTKWCFLSY